MPGALLCSSSAESSGSHNRQVDELTGSHPKHTYWYFSHWNDAQKAASKRSHSRRQHASKV